MPAARPRRAAELGERRRRGAGRPLRRRDLAPLGLPFRALGRCGRLPGGFPSVDVDVVDPGATPGTGTPEPGGLTSHQLLDAVRRVTMELPVVGLEVVEVLPPYDQAEVTAYLASRIVLEALAGLAWQRRGKCGAPTRRPADPPLGR